MRKQTLRAVGLCSLNSGNGTDYYRLIISVRRS